MTIQVNGKNYNHPLISIQQAITICDLYEEMIKKLGGCRGKPSQKLSTKVFLNVGKIEVTHKDICTCKIISMGITEFEKSLSDSMESSPSTTFYMMLCRLANI